MYGKTKCVIGKIWFKKYFFVQIGRKRRKGGHDAESGSVAESTGSGFCMEITRQDVYKRQVEG